MALWVEALVIVNIVLLFWLHPALDICYPASLHPSLPHPFHPQGPVFSFKAISSEFMCGGTSLGLLLLNLTFTYQSIHFFANNRISFLNAWVPSPKGSITPSHWMYVLSYRPVDYKYYCVSVKRNNGEASTFPSVRSWQGVLLGKHMAVVVGP